MVRAERRTAELNAKGRDITFERILDEIVARDARDAGRASAPLLIAPDAVILDTSTLDADTVFQKAVAIVEAVRGNRGQAGPEIDRPDMERGGIELQRDGRCHGESSGERSGVIRQVR